MVLSKRKLVLINCDCCGKEFYKRQQHINGNARIGYKNYCSTECVKISRDTRIEMPCGVCGKLVKRKKSEISASKSGQVFCSTSCSASRQKGKDNGNYKNGTGSYRRAVEIKKCYFCDYSEPKVLIVHHKDGNRKNNEPDNLVVLCRNCHREVHLGIKTI